MEDKEMKKGTTTAIDKEKGVEKPIHRGKNANKPTGDITQKTTRKMDTFLLFCIRFSILFSLGVLGIILGVTCIKGIPQLSLEFLLGTSSVLEERTGIFPNIINTLYLVVVTLLISTPVGVGSAIFLEEYAKKGRLVNFIQFTTEVLAGIPSIIYGLFGFMLFSITMGWGYSILSGAFTLGIMVLPIIIRTTQETLKSVPKTYREAALGLGAKKWYLIRTIVLPSSISGILTGVILATGRIVAESAALIFTAGIASELPQGLFSHLFESGGSLTIQLYRFTSIGNNDPAFGIAFVLILLVLCIHLLTNLIGRKMLKGRKR